MSQKSCKLVSVAIASRGLITHAARGYDYTVKVFRITVFLFYDEALVILYDFLYTTGQLNFCSAVLHMFRECPYYIA